MPRHLFQRAPLFLLCLTATHACSKGPGDTKPGELPGSYADAAEINIIRGPYLQNVRRDAVTVMWEAAEKCSGRVEFWSGDAYGYSSATPLAVRHEVVLKDLPRVPRTVTYRIRCVSPLGSDSIAGKPTHAHLGQKNPFKLCPGDTDPYRIAVYGDNRTLFWIHKAVVDQMVKVRPDVVVNVGDLVTTGTDYGEWDTQFFRPAKELIKFAPLFVAIGNHEENARHFYELLSQPPPENYFSFKYGNSFHVVMDSNAPFLAEGSAQMKWLEKTLQSKEAQDATWLFAYAHHPPYCEGWDEPGYDGDPLMRKLVMPMAEKAGVDIFFVGHTHDYERGQLNNVTWVLTGGGGGPLDTFQQDIKHITVFSSSWHFVSMDVDGRKVGVRAIDMGGKEIDSFSLSK